MDSSSSEDEYNSQDLSGEEDDALFAETTVRSSYSDYGGVELEELKARENHLGFRKTVVRKNPSIIYKLRVIYDRFLNEPSSSILARLWSFFIFCLIVISIVLLIIQSWPSFQKQRPPSDIIFFSFEAAIAIIFTFEYCSRLLVTFKKRWKWVIEPLNIIDLLSFLPFYIELIIVIFAGLDIDSSWLAVVRAIRLVRIFRILKLGHFTATFDTVVKAFQYSFAAFVQLLLFLFIGLVLFSTFIYFAEQTESDFNEDTEEWIYNEDSNDPGKISPFQSIPHSIWWSIVTMTTVGYGDTFPITPTGKFVAGLTMIFGLLLLAFPVGVLGTQFAEEVQNRLDAGVTEKVIKEHGDKTVEAKLRSLRNELSQFQLQLMEFNDSRGATSEYTHEMIELVHREREKLI